MVIPAADEPDLERVDADFLLLAQAFLQPPRTVDQTRWPAVVPKLISPNLTLVSSCSKPAKSSPGDTAGEVSELPLIWCTSVSGSHRARRRA